MNRIDSSSIAHRIALGAWLALIALCVLWELWIAPIRPAVSASLPRRMASAGRIRFVESPSRRQGGVTAAASSPSRFEGPSMNAQATAAALASAAA